MINVNDPVQYIEGAITSLSASSVVMNVDYSSNSYTGAWQGFYNITLAGQPGTQGLVIQL